MAADVGDSAAAGAVGRGAVPGGRSALAAALRRGIGSREGAQTRPDRSGLGQTRLPSFTHESRLTPTEGLLYWYIGECVGLQHRHSQARLSAPCRLPYLFLTGSALRTGR